MLNTNLKQQWADMVKALKEAERFYALDDNHAVHVEIDVGRFDAERLTARVCLHEKIEEKRGDVVEIEWDCIDLESLPARLLGRVVELKLNVERWNANELDQLPPSTMGDFLSAQEARRMERRRARFRR